MTPIDLTTYEGQVERLDLDYIAERGRWIDAHLAAAGEPVGLTYEPGNSTSYALVFVPVASIDQLGEGLVPAGAGWDSDGHHSRERWVIVAKVNRTPADFAFNWRLEPGDQTFPRDILERTPQALGLADACALTALFRAITGVGIR